MIRKVHLIMDRFEIHFILKLGTIYMGRDVAQFGSALDLGSSGRRFKSCHPEVSNLAKDQSKYVYSSIGRIQVSKT